MNTGDGFQHDLALCEDCRRKRYVDSLDGQHHAQLIFFSRKSDFETTEITLRIFGPNDTIPTGDARTENRFRPARPLQQSTLLTYGSRRNGTVRQSNRIRQSKHAGKHHAVSITKEMTVKSLKIMVSLPTICEAR